MVRTCMTETLSCYVLHISYEYTTIDTTLNSHLILHHTKLLFSLMPIMQVQHKEGDTKCRFIRNVDDLMSNRCFFSNNCDALFFSTHFPTCKRVTYNTLFLETDVDFIAVVCGFSHNVDTVSYALGYQNTFAWHTHLSPTIQLQAATQYASKTQESNVSVHDEQKVKVREGSRRGTQMHNLSKSHQTDICLQICLIRKNTCKQMNLPVVVSVY